MQVLRKLFLALSSEKEQRLPISLSSKLALKALTEPESNKTFGGFTLNAHKIYNEHPLLLGISTLALGLLIGGFAVRFHYQSKVDMGNRNPIIFDPNLHIEKDNSRVLPENECAENHKAGITCIPINNSRVLPENECAENHKAGITCIPINNSRVLPENECAENHKVGITCIPINDPRVLPPGIHKNQHTELACVEMSTHRDISWQKVALAQELREKTESLEMANFELSRKENALKAADEHLESFYKITERYKEHEARQSQRLDELQNEKGNIADHYNMLRMRIALYAPNDDVKKSMYGFHPQKIDVRSGTFYFGNEADTDIPFSKG